MSPCLAPKGAQNESKDKSSSGTRRRIEPFAIAMILRCKTSAALARAEDCAADSDVGRAKSNRGLKIAAHTHAETGNARFGGKFG